MVSGMVSGIKLSGMVSGMVSGIKLSGMISDMVSVTFLAWIAHILVSSNRPTGLASLDSCRAITQSWF